MVSKEEPWVGPDLTKHGNKGMGIDIYRLIIVVVIGERWCGVSMESKHEQLWKKNSLQQWRFHGFVGSLRERDCRDVVMI